MTEPQHIVDALLKDVSVRTKHKLNDNPDLAAAIKYFLEQKAAGNPAMKHLTLAWFYREKLRERFSGPGPDSVRSYVREVLKLDLLTGAAL